MGGGQERCRGEGRAGSKASRSSCLMLPMGRGDFRREFLDVSLDSGTKSHPSRFPLKDFSKSGGYFSRLLVSAKHAFEFSLCDERH